MAGDENEENKDDKNENQGIENQNEQEDEEYRNPNHPTAPSAPTKEEWIEHQITHVPYKSWCPICVKNAAVNNPHKLTHHFRGVAQFCMEYMYMTKKPDEEQIMHPILVIKERVSGGTWALATIRKGAFQNKLVRRIIEIIDGVGSPKIIIKSDQEPAMVEIQQAVRK